MAEDVETDEQEAPEEESKQPKKMAKPNYGSMFGLAPVEVLETGILPLDMVLGGGYTQGDMIQISSPSGVGKSTLVLHAVKNFVKGQGRKVCYCDIETGVKPSMLQNYGLLDIASPDPSKGDFLFLRPRTYKDMDQIFHDLIRNYKFSHIVLDSITSLSPTKLQERGVEDVQIGEQARLCAVLLWKWKAVLREYGVTCWLINQARVKGIGAGRNMKFVEGGAGGRAQDHYPDIRLMMRMGKRLTRSEETAKGTVDVPYGNVAAIWAEKNRSDRPAIPVDCPILFGRGVSNVLFMLDILKKQSWITGGTGGHYKLKTPGGIEEKIYGTEALEGAIRSLGEKLKNEMKQAGLFNLVYGEKAA